MTMAIAIPAINEVPPGLRFILKQKTCSRCLIKRLERCCQCTQDCPLTAECQSIYDRLVDRTANLRAHSSRPKKAVKNAN